LTKDVQVVVFYVEIKKGKFDKVITQAEIAEKPGISQRTVSSALSGSPGEGGENCKG